MQKWLLTIIIAILPVITACSKTDTEVSVPEEETGKKTEIKFLQLNLWVECTKVEHAPEYLIDRTDCYPTARHCYILRII